MPRGKSRRRISSTARARMRRMSKRPTPRQLSSVQRRACWRRPPPPRWSGWLMTRPRKRAWRRRRRRPPLLPCREPSRRAAARRSRPCRWRCSMRRRRGARLAQRSLPARGQRGGLDYVYQAPTPATIPSIGQQVRIPLAAQTFRRRRSTRRRPRWRPRRFCARASATTASGRCCAGRRRSSVTASWSASARSRPPVRAATSSFRWAPIRTCGWCDRSSRARRPPGSS